MSDARLRERVAELEGLLDNERLYTAEHRGYAQVVGEENKRLREQLDAARQALREIAGHDGHTAFEYCVPMMVEAARAALGVEGEQEKAREKPNGWPEKCGSCGASWEHIGFDAADGFNCRVCGRCDSDE